MFRYNPVSLRPSGLAESPLLLIGLALRLFVVDRLFARADDFSRCGIIRTIFRAQEDGYTLFLEPVSGLGQLVP